MSIRVPFLDLRVHDSSERAVIIAAVTAVLDHGRLILGPEVAELERRIADFCGRSHCIGVGSGTDALILALKALGIGSGDEVITPALSWLATGSSILLNGATAVFCDIDETLNIDPTTVEPLITARTKAILPVHFTGRLARMPEITELARHHNLLVIEDGSQAFGATFHGRPCGAFGNVACISLNAFDDDGRATRVISLGEVGSGKTHVYRLSDPVWHSVIIQSEFAAIHEVTNGPFREEESDFAPWTPADPVELRRFLARSVSTAPREARKPTSEIKSSA